MRQLRITRNGLELALVSLRQPVSMVGRSPSCDGVLRAPGVAPVQFMLESQGEGTDKWVIFDVSDESGEGKVLGLGKVEFRGFYFEITEVPLGAVEELGGGIQRSLMEGAGARLPDGRKLSLVEAVRIRRDSGAIQEVSHLRVATGGIRRKRRLQPFEDLSFVEIFSEGEKVSLRFLGLPGATGPLRFHRNNEIQALKANSPIELGVRDWVKVELGLDDLYFRWVSPVAPVQIRREVIGIPFLRWGMLAGLLFALAMGGSIWLKSREEPVPVVVTPPRIAAIEIKEAPPPPPPPPPLSVMPLQPQAEKSQQKQPSKSGAASAARFQKPVAEKQRNQSGLNAPAPTANVNSLGLLGALKSSAPAKGPGVRADQIFNDSVVTQAVASADSGSIALKNPPSGVLGVGPSGGAPNAKANGDGLQALSTTVSGAGEYVPSDVGAIGRPGGKGKGQGSGLSGLDSLGGDGDGKGQFAGFDSSGTDVRGGLDRETVRRVIVSNRGKIRACYERALLAQPKLAGRVVTRFQISATGPVVSASMGSSDANSPTLESCLLEVVRAMQFPAAATGKPTFVIYPFVFQARAN